MKEKKYLSQHKGNRICVYGILLVASIGGFISGFEAVISVALPSLSEYFHLTPVSKGFAVSSAILGSTAGPLIGLWMADRLGRRGTMMVAAAFFLVSTFGTPFSQTIWHFTFWRFLGGVGIGLVMISSPIYIAELSPPVKRGSLVNVNQLSNVIGINMAVVVGYILSVEGSGWPWMFGVRVVPAIFLITGLLLIPESPRWLAAQNRLQEAKGVLAKINGTIKAEAELKEIHQQLSREEGNFRELFLPGIRLALFIGVTLMVFSQINGVNMMLLYGPTILVEAGITTSSNAMLSSLPVYLFIFICTLLSFRLIKKYSRRRLLITSVLFMALGHIIMAVNLLQAWPPLFTLVPMLIGTGAFTLGFAPLSWIIVSEIFPNKIRGKALAITCFFLYGSSFTTAQVFPMVTDWFNKYFHNPSGVYWTFTVICVSCAVFSWKKVPETKGLSLEKISEFWIESRKKINKTDLHMNCYPGKWKKGSN